MQILIFNEPEGKLMTISQTSWCPREALGWGEEGGPSDKEEEREGGKRMEQRQSRGCRVVEGGEARAPCTRACLLDSLYREGRERRQLANHPGR